MKRKNGAGTVPAKAREAPAGAGGGEDMVVGTPRQHLLDEFAARPRLRRPPHAKPSLPSAD